MQKIRPKLLLGSLLLRSPLVLILSPVVFSLSVSLCYIFMTITTHPKGTSSDLEHLELTVILILNSTLTFPNLKHCFRQMVNLYLGSVTPV